MADEYINKGAFNDAIREAVRRCPSTFYNGLEVARQIAHDMDAADVVPVRHGRWISDGAGKRFGTVVRLDKDGCAVDTCHCSECGEWLTASDEYPVIGYYCPNCGAKMDSEA